MSRAHKQRFYDISSYDRHLCLKPSAGLWIVILLLSRAIALPLVAQLASISGVGSETTSMVHGLFALRELAPALPAFLVGVALLGRAPRNGPLLRWLLAKGRPMLCAAASLDLALCLTDVSTWPPRLTAPVASTVGPAVLDLLAFTYVVAARRVRDVFASTPQAPVEPALARSE